MTKRYAIIGTGPAGVVAAESLRQRDKEVDVMLIGGEGEAPYSRMAIPYYLIGNVKEQGTHLRKFNGHFDAMDINLVNDRVLNIDAAAKSINLTKGGTHTYDKLVLATGSNAVRPPINGIDSPNVYNCWTLDDARAISKHAKKGSKVVLMGAGFIGCIILEALARSGVDLTVIEMEDRMVPRMMNEDTGGLIKKWCEKEGVRVLTSTSVTGIETVKKGILKKSLVVNTSATDPIEADMVICATGVRPNIDLAQQAGLKTDSGIIIDRNMRTSNEDIYAIGDVAEGADFSTGNYSVQAIQPTAADHARYAAANIIGGDNAAHPGSLVMNVLDTMGLISASFGKWDGVDGGDTALLHNPDAYKYLELQFDGDVLVGANSLGMTNHIGALRGLIQSRAALGKWKERLMENPLSVMEAYLATAQAQA